ncbi:MAG: STAS domain-containing protein [Desulfuromonadaceae bacterium]
MRKETGDTVHIHLDGDWSMSAVAEKIPVLVEGFVRVTGTVAAAGQHQCPTDTVPEIDMAGVTDFDACGCQLLALFVCNLKQKGFSTQVINIPDALRSRIHFLGFDKELNLLLDV